MAFQVSPGVQVNEIDATNVVPAVSTSIGGFVGAFNWGPVEEVTTVGSENELASIFGTPDSDTAKYFLTAASFLKYGNALKVVRAEKSDMKNATDGTALLIKNEDHYDSLSSLSGTFVAKYPGVLGNSLKVEICSNATSFGVWTDSVTGINPKDSFDSAPGTSDSAAQNTSIIIEGNLQVRGDSSSLDVSTLRVEDKQIELAITDGSTLLTNAQVDDGGVVLRASGEEKKWTWQNSTNKLNLNNSGQQRLLGPKYATY